MTSVTALVSELQSSLQFFERSSACLTEEDSEWCPAPGMMTVAQQIAHVAQTVDWFREGAFGAGFQMDFEAHAREIEGHKSVEKARAYVREAYQRVIERVESSTMEELSVALPEGMVMPGEPRHHIVTGISEHTAHHRGALTVYSRLRGKTPSMPYMDM